MGRVTKLVITIVTIGVATAAFAGVAGAGSTLSKKAYLKEGNAICKAANKDLDGVFEEFFGDFEEGDVPTPEQQRQVADAAIPIFSQALDEIEALEGPAALDKKVDTLIADYRAVVEAVDADPSIALSPDSTDPFVKPDKKAKKLGLKQCEQN